MESGKIIVVANQKGGVAKTSTVRNLSYALAEMGKKVLVVDFDPQYNLTTSFGVLPTQAPYNTGTLITNLLLDESLPDTNEFIQKIGSVDLIPSSRSLTVAEANLLMTPDSNDYLAALLNPLRLSYDYIITILKTALTISWTIKRWKKRRPQRRAMLPVRWRKTVLHTTALPSMTPKHASASASTVITRTKRRRNRQQPLRWSMTPHSKTPQNCPLFWICISLKRICWTTAVASTSGRRSLNTFKRTRILQNGRNFSKTATTIYGWKS